jgi:hypothetical protein
MIYRKILSVVLLLQVTSLYGVQLGHNLLKNSPNSYLIDLQKSLNDAEATLQTGQELSLRNATDYMQLYDQVAGGVNDEPAGSYDYMQGMWVWVADTPVSEAGVWYWIPKTHSLYVAIFLGLPYIGPL